MRVGTGASMPNGHRHSHVDVENHAPSIFAYSILRCIGIVRVGPGMHTSTMVLGLIAFYRACYPGKRVVGQRP